METRKRKNYFYKTTNFLKLTLEGQHCLVKKDAIYLSRLNFVKNYQIIVNSVTDGSVTGCHFVRKYYAAIKMASYFRSSKGTINLAG